MQRKGKAGNCKQQGASKQVAGKGEGAEKVVYSHDIRKLLKLPRPVLLIEPGWIKAGRLDRKSLARSDNILLLNRLTMGRTTAASGHLVQTSDILQ